MAKAYFGRRYSFCVALVAAISLTSHAVGQQQVQPNVPSDLVEDLTEFVGDQITFCINQGGLLAEFDRDVARALGDVLLLEVEFFEVDPPLRNQFPADYRLPVTVEEAFVLMTDECDAFMGWPLSTAGIPEWMTVSRPYVESTWQLVTTNDDYDSFEAIPSDVLIGTRMMSNADISFGVYTRAQNQGLRRIPYPDDHYLVERLLDGTLETAFVWTPALYRLTDGDPEAAGLRPIPFSAFSPHPQQFAIAMRARALFLRGVFDEGISALVRDGVIDSLLEVHGIRGSSAGLD